MRASQAQETIAPCIQGVASAAALAAVCAVVIATFGPLLGMDVPTRVLVILACGAVAVEIAPARALQTATGVGVLALAATNKVYALYHLILVAALYAARNHTARLAVVLGALAIWVPKHLFAAHYHQVGFYNWINEPSLALAIFVAAAWWRARRDGALPAGARDASFASWAALFFFPGHAVNPMVYGPGELFRERRLEVRGVLVALVFVAAKALAHAGLYRLFPSYGYATFDAARAASASRAQLWGVALFNYADLAITLSGTADLAILIARLYGWPLPAAFRWALLAWNPSELWRRWGIYNRKFLLKLVYFPLGGGQRRRLLNVMLTFLASALVLHTGWFGSKYWEIGPGGWRDETIYFLLQGIMVCAWLLLAPIVARVAGPPPSDDEHRLRVTPGRVVGTAITQGLSALVHVVVLAQALPFADRWTVMARCLWLR
jgi:hypothetical protein